MRLPGRRPGWGAIALLVIGLILLLSDGDEEGDRRRPHGDRPPRGDRPPEGDQRAPKAGGDRRGPTRGRDRRGPQGGVGGVRVRVTRIVDGDTIEVALGGETENVRYIGVDTPETVAPGEPVGCYGHRASDFNQRLVGGETVRLVFGAERRDRYGRLLAYVYVGSRFVNAELVREGYARTLAIAPNTDRAGLFERLERRAGAAGRGLWGACDA
jgi:micrococcal nuclease